MPRILQAFARVYQKSASGRRGSARDFTIDHEKFLRLAGADDGDEREIAERELAVAESESRGLFQIDRQPRTGAAIRLRLSKDGGEEWLFQRTGGASPEERRRRLAEYFTRTARCPVPGQWRQPWAEWFSKLAELSLRGESVHPFRRDDPEGNEALTNAIAGVLNWRGPSLVRYASAAICGNSKQLQILEPRLRVALEAVTGSSSLEDFGIFRKPRAITFHGPLAIVIDSTCFDFAPFPAPVTLSEANFTRSPTITTTAPLCLTIENEDTFHELAATNPGVLLILTSYPGSAVLRLVERLPAELPFHHFGDSDPAGSDILRDLRVKTGRNIQPLLVAGAQARHSKRTPLSEHDIRTLKRVLDANLPVSLRPHLEHLLESGEMGDFEQETIPVAEVWKSLEHAIERPGA